MQVEVRMMWRKIKRWCRTRVFHWNISKYTRLQMTHEQAAAAGFALQRRGPIETYNTNIRIWLSEDFSDKVAWMEENYGPFSFFETPSYFLFYFMDELDAVDFKLRFL